MTYTVKMPVRIDAIQYTGNNFAELYDFAGDDIYLQDGQVYIHTIECDIKMKNKIGDYLVKGVKGEFYFCEKSIFEELYEKCI